MTPDSTMPPTIGDLKAIGLTGALIWCVNSDCGRSATVSWEKIGLPDATPFPSVVKRKRFVCAGCGSTKASAIPDWSGHRASGTGG